MFCWFVLDTKIIQIKKKKSLRQKTESQRGQIVGDLTNLRSPVCCCWPGLGCCCRFRFFAVLLLLVLPDPHAFPAVVPITLYLCRTYHLPARIMSNIKLLFGQSTCCTTTTINLLLVWFLFVNVGLWTTKYKYKKKIQKKKMRFKFKKKKLRFQFKKKKKVKKPNWQI